MFEIAKMNFDYHQPIKLADGVFWVGSYSENDGLRYNPYIVVDGDEAVIIDGGRRNDFPSVMLKILQIGISPENIKAIIYHHYDPDRCGSLSNFEDIIDSDKLNIISEKENLVLIKHYNSKSSFVSTEELGYKYIFKSGRELHFIKTPYSQSVGSFMTFDTKSKVLFSSELMSSYGGHNTLFLEINKNCKDEDSEDCPLKSIIKYHRNIFSSERALKSAVEKAANVDFGLIAPQRGMIVTNVKDAVRLFVLLADLKGVGIDAVLGNRSYNDLGNIDNLIERVNGNDS